MLTKQVTIRDIVIISVPQPHEVSTGEAGTINGSAAASKDNESAVVLRLTNCIHALIDLAASDHQANNTMNDPDYLTRLSTHEFFFYTQEPLSMTDFTILQNTIAMKLKASAPGIQLILGSFAIKNSHNEIMNVTPVLSSGDPVSFHFLVKNYTSPIDVTYKNDKEESFKPFDINSENPLPTISIDNETRAFQFENFIQCHTAGKMPFLTIVDICLDHFYGTAKKYITTGCEKTPALTEQPLTQIIISNTVEIQPEYCLLGPVLHVDPRHSKTGCKYGVRQIESITDLAHHFGKKKLFPFFLNPAVCLTGDNFHISPQIASICDQLRKIGPGSNQKVLMQIIAFIERYGDINAVINSGMTPLHYAAKSGLIGAFDILLQHGATIDVKTHQHYTPLHYAAQNGHINVVHRILEKDPKQREATIDTGANALHLAIVYNRLEVVQLLIARGANIDAKMPNGWTPLEIAVTTNNRDFVDILVSKGARIETEILLAAKSKTLRNRLVSAILDQKHPSPDVQNQIVDFILQDLIDPNIARNPIKNPILRAKIYWAERHIDPFTICMDGATQQTAMFVRLYKRVQETGEFFKDEFADILMNLIDSDRPEEILLAKQVIIRVYEIYPETTDLQKTLDHFIKIDQPSNIALSQTTQKSKIKKEADIQKQLHLLKLAYLKAPYDEGQLLDAFKKLCKSVAYRRNAIDFFGTTTSMKNLAKVLSAEENSGLRAALKITSTNQQKLLRLIDTYAQQKDLERYAPNPKPPSSNRHH